jgi:hypothetical protein
MRAPHQISLGVLAGMLVAASAVAPAHAQNEPVIVVPGRPGVQVMMYGIDVSGAVIEGEFGLNRPGVVAPTVIMPFVSPGVVPAPGAYFPSTGQQPAYGRLEVVPPDRRGPQTGAPYFRVWGTESAPTPATSPLDNPPMVVVTPPAAPERHPKSAPVPHPPPPPKTP